MRRSRTSGAIWAAVFVALVAWLIAAAVIGVSRSNSYHRELRYAQNQQHFYQVLSGKEQNGTKVSDALAAALKPINDNNLRFFTGNSNSYGGISHELGYDPFDESCGIECGPLTREALTKITDARHGNVSVSRPRKPSSSWQVSLLALCFWLIAGVVYASAPTIERIRSRRKVEHSYPDEWRTIERLNRALESGSLSRLDAAEVRQLRDNLTGALNLRVGSTGDYPITERRIESLKQEAQGKLEAMEAGNRILES